MYVGQKLKYIYIMTNFIGDVIILSIHKDNSVEPTYCFHYIIWQSKGATWSSQEEILSP